MTAPTTSSSVLEHVRAYAAQVRAHLADLAPEQVEDLTDGLEADLAEALADSAGPVGTGEAPAVPGGSGPATVLDLTARFGPVATYAAELRASAGLGEAAPGGAGRRVRGPGPVTRVRARASTVVRGWQEALAPFLGTPQGAALRGFLVSLVPVWWVARAWVWFVLLTGLFGGDRAQRLLPSNGFTWLMLVALVVGSVTVGRGPRIRNDWWRRLLVAASVVAVLLAPWALGELRYAIGGGLAGSAVEYVEVPVYEQVPAEPQDGVYVDGTLVSNLFVYDAQGNPLERVQIFDDRGRQVRTTHDGGTEGWFMPGVEEPWLFGPDLTADGRERWNVYPLQGLPVSQVEGGMLPGTGLELLEPPLPFAQAPTLADPVDEASAAPGDAAGGTAP